MKCYKIISVLFAATSVLLTSCRPTTAPAQGTTTITEAEAASTTITSTQTETTFIETEPEQTTSEAADAPAEEETRVYEIHQSSEIYPNPSILYSYKTEVTGDSPETDAVKETTPAHVNNAPAIPYEGEFSPSVLMYHLILDEPYSNLTGLFVRPSDFEDHLRTLNNLGYEYIFADEFRTTTGKSIALTFDDGYADNYTEMFPILKKYNAKATIFIITDSVDTAGYMTSAQIKEMAASGLVHFGSHTVTHQSLTGFSDAQLRKEFSASKEIIENLTGQRVSAICYPGGSVNGHVAGIASEYYSFGYTTVASSNTKNANPMLIPRVRVSRGMSGSGLANSIK